MPGIVADRFGRFNTLIIMSAISGILVLALWIPARSNAALILFSYLYGAFSGAYVSLGPSVVAQISPISEIGVRNGVTYAIVAIAVLTGNPIGGALLTRGHGDYLYLQVFCGLTMCVATALFVVARAMQVGMKMKIV